MNDNELDRLLDTWEAPHPPLSMREGLRARFPRAERRRFARPRKWVLLIAAVSATLAISMGQSGDNRWASQIASVFERLYENLVHSFDAWRAASIVARIRQSEPKVYVDGQLAAPLEYDHAAKINVQVPDEGVYSLISYPGVAGWVEAGYIRGSVIEFVAGSKRVRIECNRPIVDSELPIFTRRQKK